MLTTTQGMLIKIALTAGLISFLLFLRAAQFDFVNYDDPRYVYENPAIRNLDWRFIYEAFTTSYMGWWMPLTWISFAVDYHFWGVNPAGYHLENIIFHGFNTALVVLVADQLLRGRSAGGRYPLILLFSALLWAVHPLRVESVAWVTERKDVLNGFFSLLTLFFYLRYAAQQGAAPSGQRRRAYLLALVFFLLSLMTKPLSVVLPVMFLVLDGYPLKRFAPGGLRKLLLEKIPFFAVSAALVVLTLLFASGETILVSLADHPLQNRLLVAGFALGEYLRLTVWPSGLVHFYPINPEMPPVYYLHSVLFAVLAAAALLNIKKYPAFAACLALFILPLLPVLGFFQNGDQSHANRFVYLSSVFPCIAAGGLVMILCGRAELATRAGRYVLLAGLSGLLALYALITITLLPVWRNSETLWTRQITVLPVGRAYYYRGDYLLRSGEYGRAAADFAIAARMAAEAGNPELFNLHALRGAALLKGGRYAEAVDEFTTAISIRPFAHYFYHRSLALSRLGRHAEAGEDLRAAGGDTSPIDWRTVADGKNDPEGSVSVPLTVK